MTRHLWLMAAALLLGIAPADARRKPVAPPPAPSTDTLVENVNGYTLDKAGTLVRFNGLLIDADGRVKALLKPGDRRDPVKYRTDAKGRTLLPGFIGLDGDVMEAGRLPPSPENERFRDNPVELEAVLTRAQERLAAAGITTASDLGTTTADWMLYRRFGDEGRLHIRISAIADGLGVLEQVAPLRPTPRLYDGRLAMRAVTLTPEAQPGKAPPGQMDARMRNLVSKALMVDAQPVLQAGSPAQGAVALDIYDEMLPTYGKDRRYRIAYAVAPALADRPRLAAINGVATVQPAAISRTLLADGVRTAISSDVGTDATAVFRGLAASISRPDGLSLQQAFAAVTSEAAFAIAAEDRLGTLEPGKWADFILVDRDIFVTPASELPQTRVIETWVGGRRVFVAKP